MAGESSESGSKMVVVERVVKELGSTIIYPELTRTNYHEWELVMRVNLEAQGLWEAIEDDKVERREDRLALAALLRAVPAEMRSTLAVKKSAKEAWEAIRVMRMGVARVQEANAQKLLKEFENIGFKDGESVDDFAMRIAGLASNLRALGETVEEVRVVKKILRVVPPQYSQIALSIETLLDLKTVSVEELVGRLRAAEDRFDVGAITDKAGRLLLAEEEWLAKYKSKSQTESSTGSNKAVQGKAKGGARSYGRDTAATSEGKTRRRGKCHNCGIYGHWAKECRKPRRERKEEAHIAQVEDQLQHPALLMATTTTEKHSEMHEVHLNESKVHPLERDDGMWVLDTGASNHMTGCRSALSSFDESVHGTVHFGDGSVVEICGLGSVVMQSRDHSHKVLTEVYYIPKLRSNIVSLGQLEEGGCKIELKDGFCSVFDSERTLLARAPRIHNRLYLLKIDAVAPVCLVAKIDDQAWLWHARYGHLNFRALRELGMKHMVEGLPLIERKEEVCDGCALGKQQRIPFPQAAVHRGEQSLDLFHVDLCGPIRPNTPGGKNYFMLIVDDYSRYMWAELIASKDEAFKAFKRVKALAETELGRRLKAFRSDRGGEFNSREFQAYCDEHGIKHFTTMPYSPQQNGVVERRNRTVVEMARCLLKSKNMPAYFWGEAVMTAIYILNRAPTSCLEGKTPYEAWHNRRPNVKHLRTFGCVVHVKRIGPDINKLTDRSVPMVFLGYEPGTKGYRVYEPGAKKLHVSRDVVFEEHRAWDWSKEVGDTSPPASFDVKYFSEVRDAEPRVEEISSPPTPATPGSEPSTPAAAAPAISFATPPTDGAYDSEGVPQRFRTLENLLDTTEEINEYEYSGLCMLAAEEPLSVEAALGEVEWREAMEAEMESIRNNKTWEPAVLPPEHKAIGLKWVFKVKKDPAGNVIKHKARLVAKGYAQRQGVDFDEVFAPVARIETVRLLLALAAHGGWHVHHMDVKSAFLNGDLVEDVYVQQPPGFTDDKSRGKVLKLKKALYGLRQAPRAWNAKLDTELLGLGFRKNLLEHAVYRRGTGENFLLVGVYVDDLIITGPSKLDIEAFKVEMKEKFDMSDLGLLSYYLGIEVCQKKGEITICQSAFAAKILENAGMAGCNRCHTPMENRLKLSKTGEGEPVDATKFRSIVGSLRYLVNTRPDLAYSVGIVSRYMEAPTTKHWAAVKQILRYLAGTISYGCRYKRSQTEEPMLVGFSDSDHAGDIDDRKSTSGFIFFLGSSLISWTSQKQRVVALSSCEAEYIAGSAAACQGIWLSRILGEFMGKEAPQVKLLIDNKSTIALCKNPVHHDRSKHIDTRYHFIRHCVEKGKILVEYVSTNDQLADILTKALGRVKFVEFRRQLGVVELQQD